jgi:subtilisin family serine protease
MNLRSLLIILAATTLLTVAAEPVQAQSAMDKLEPWVVENTANGAIAEYLVVLAEQADLSGAADLPTKHEKGRFVRDRLWRVAQRTQEPLLAELRTMGVEHRSYYIVNLIWVRGDRETALTLAAREDVARIEGNPWINNFPNLGQPEDGPTQPRGIEPGISYSGAPDVWSLGYSGQGLVVAGADTGIDWDHPALINQYQGWNGSSADHDYSWHDSIHAGGGVCGPNSPEPCDDHGHGTHTIGTVAGDDGFNNQIGMAPGARWIGCRNMNVGNGSPATYLECFEFFLAPYPVNGTPAQGDPYRAPDVTNNSWSCPPSEGCSHDTLLAAVQAQRAAGIMTVSSAGNSGSSCSSVSDPAAIYDESYTVGALNTGSDTLAGFSSRGPVTVDGSNRTKPDISAPGTSTRSAYPGGGYASMSGTSMAGPHVAGAAAVVMSAFPTLNGQPALTEQKLNQSAINISTSSCSSTAGVYPNNLYGWGRLSVDCAVPGLVSGGGETCAGDDATLQADLTGAGPWDVHWSDGHTQSGVTVSPATRTVSPTFGRSYTADVDNGTCSTRAAGIAYVSAYANLISVVIYATGDTTICPGCQGATFNVNTTGGGPCSHQWGYRLVPGGPVTALPGRTGASYLLDGNDFPGPGTYYVVAESTPQCGSPKISNEVEVLLVIPVELMSFTVE